MRTAAVAVGVTCTFGAPIGGVLFAIEVSSSVFTVQNLWISFFASTVTVLLFKALGKYDSQAFFTADASYFFKAEKAIGINQEQPFFVGLGVLCGIVGTLYIQFQRKVNQWKGRNKDFILFKINWIYTLGMCFIVTSTIYLTRIMQTPDKGIIQSMIDVDRTLDIHHESGRLDRTSQADINKFQQSICKFDHETMHDPQLWVLCDGFMIIFLLQKFLFTALTLSCPVPGGIFTPTFALGAVLGQLYVSQVLSVLQFFGYEDFVEYRGIYSVLGAAAMTASVTRTVSVAMIVLELNGHLSHAVPLMVCVLSSYATSELLKPESFFEMLTALGGLDQQVKERG